METKPIPLGSTCVDTVTNFEGVATARCEYLHGTPRIQLSAKSESSQEKLQVEWFDEPALTNLDAE